MKNPGPNPTELLRSLALDTPMSRQPSSVMPQMLWPALHAENFEGAYNWKPMTTYCTGTDYVQEAAAEAALTGSFGLNLKTKATTPAALDCVAVYRHASMGPCAFIRYQGALAFVTPNVSARFDIFFFFLDGPIRYKAGMLLYTSGRADYLGSDGNGHQLTQLMTVVTPNSWNKLDIMIDVHAHRYAYVALNAVRLPLTEPVLEYGTWDDTSLALDLLLTTLDAAQAQAYVDELLVTPHQAPPIF